ncbi:MAG TPA: hypothetical protein VHX86_09085 [Tepidisphaeraceae bacterium]|nr:hypothetical protein [Tepidisphaeraceae bacterium]
MGKINFRLIFTITALGIVILIAALFIGIGYEAAASHAIGHFAPIGQGTNGKHK